MIRAILADDERPALDELRYLLRNYPVEILAEIQDGCELPELIRRLRPDALFLDIDMPGENGLALALKIQEQEPTLRIVFVTAYSDYALEAFKAYPVDYILKPVDERRFAKTMEHLLRLTGETQADDDACAKPQIRCFGKFEAFTVADGRRDMKFATRQAKEMFAYLISRFDREVSRDELLDTIFGGGADKRTVNLLHVTAYRLRHAMEEARIGRESVTLGGSYLLRVAEGVCDYADFMRFCDRNPYIDGGNIARAEAAAVLYRGGFLEEEDYLWAEEPRAEAERRFVTLLLGAADFRRGQGNFELCEKALVMLLQVDGLSEEGNKSLLELYIAADNHPKFIEHYERYRALLHDELQTEPERRYAEYYGKIMREI